MSETISIPLGSLRRSASFYPDSSVPSAIEEASDPGLSPITDDPSSLGAHWEGSSTQAVVFQTTLPKTSPPGNMTLQLYLRIKGAAVLTVDYCFDEEPKKTPSPSLQPQPGQSHTPLLQPQAHKNEL